MPKQRCFGFRYTYLKPVPLRDGSSVSRETLPLTNRMQKIPQISNSNPP